MSGLNPERRGRGITAYLNVLIGQQIKVWFTLPLFGGSETMIGELQWHDAEAIAIRCPGDGATDMYVIQKHVVACIWAQSVKAETLCGECK